MEKFMNIKVSKGQKKWIEVIPYGLVGGMAPGLSLVVFKENKGESRFAIWLSQLQSQVAVQQGLKREETFSFLNPILRHLNMTPQECYFVKNENGEQFVKVIFKKNEEKLKFVLKADETVAFCIYHNCKFFCTMEFIESMKSVQAGKYIKKVKRESPSYLN